MKEIVKRTLILVFGSNAGDVKVTINKPKDNLTKQDIINGMDGMINAKALGEEYLVKKIAGLEETKRHLENLGFICGAQVCVIAVMNKSLIVQIKDSRVAISRELAEKIMI